MAAKLAAGRFPSAELLRGAGETGVQAKRVQEPIRRNAHHERAVVVRSLLARAGKKAHLRHGIWRGAQFGVLPRKDKGLGKRQRLAEALQGPDARRRQTAAPFPLRNARVIHLDPGGSATPVSDRLSRAGPD
jgi:hypothetical protein